MSRVIYRRNNRFANDLFHFDDHYHPSFSEIFICISTECIHRRNLWPIQKIDYNVLASSIYKSSYRVLYTNNIYDNQTITL